MIDFLEIVWPRLIGPSEEQIAKNKERQRAELRAISRQSWRQDTDAALEEARRLTDTEAERRKTADSKAATYLTVVGVLIPILTSLGPSLSDGKTSPILRAISVPLLILAVVYLTTAGIWAFRAIRVSQSHRVDSDDLVQIWSRPARKAALVKRLLRTAYANRNPVNDKVSRIKMTDAYLMRAFITFATLLIIQTSWKPTCDIITAIYPEKKKETVVTKGALLPTTAKKQPLEYESEQSLSREEPDVVSAKGQPVKPSVSKSEVTHMIGEKKVVSDKHEK